MARRKKRDAAGAGAGVGDATLPTQSIFAHADDMRRRTGRPSFKPRDGDRRYVQTMAALGLSYEDIARTVGIDRGTLAKHFDEELHLGRIQAHATVAAALFRKATSTTISGATVRAAEIWLRAKAGWVDAQPPRLPSEDEHDQTITIEGGLPDPTDDPVVDAASDDPAAEAQVSE